MTKKGIFVLSILIISIQSLFGQIKYANLLFEEQNYVEAIPLYERVIEKKGESLEVIENLAYCYKVINDYENAEKYFGKAVTYENCNPTSYLYYGQLLKSSNKINQARTQFIKHNEVNPGSLVGKLMLKSCDNIMEWSSKPIEFKIHNVQEVNSPLNEIGPFPYKDGIIFTSENKFLSSEEDKKSKSEETPSYSIYYMPFVNGSPGEITSFFGRNSKDDYEGPAFLNKSEDVVYYNKVFDTRKFLVNQIKIYYSKYENGVWGDPIQFYLSNNKYTITNPVLSPTMDTIFFASDMEGGYGGMDIYYCVKYKDGNWGKATNLGPLLNTEGIEIPSYYDEKRTLYFSSNFHPGYGGFDIFKSKWDGTTWAVPENMKSPLNSTKDELGYVPVNKNLGYFSSNRDGGLGKDDIYMVGVLDTNDLDNYTTVTGIFEFEGLPMDNVTLNLLDENDVLIQSSVTNNKGEFEFNGIPPGANYKIIVDEPEENIPDAAQLFLTNSNHKKIRLLSQIRKGLFEFKALTTDEYDNLPLMNVEDEELDRLTILGEVYNKMSKEVPPGTQVTIMDDEQNILGEAKTDDSGGFIFKNLKFDDQFLFRLAENDPDLEINILNKNKELLAATTRNDDGDFVYLTNFQKSVKNPDIAGTFKYGKLPASDVELNLLDANDAMLQKTKTDEQGNFRFTKLDAGKDYSIQVSPSEGKVPKNASLFLTDAATGQALPVMKSGRGSFTFKTLAYDEPEELTLMNIQDENAIKINLKGEIYSITSQKVPEKIDVHLIDRNGNISATAVKISNGKFEFNQVAQKDTMLLKLSNNNPDLNVKITNENGEVFGITNRIDNGNLEYYTNLQKSVKNPDVAGVFKYGKLPASDVQLNLMSENDEMLQYTKTDANGEFEFNNLASGSNYSIQVDKSAGTVPKDAKMYLKDKSTGRLLPVAKSGTGTFKFQTLAYDEPEDLVLIPEIDANAIKVDILAQVYHKLSKDLPPKMDVYLLDDKGNIIATAVPTSDGKFQFKNINQSDSFLIKLSENNPDLELKIINKQGQLIGTTKKNEEGIYVYKTNIQKSVQNPDVAGVFQYGKLPAQDVQLNLMDENDQMVQFTNTDQKGEFEFKKLIAGKSYSIQVDKSAGEIPDNASLQLKDKATGQLLPIMKSGKNTFKFQTLAYIEPEEPALMSTKDEDSIVKSFLSKLNYKKLPYDLVEGMELYLLNDDDLVLSKTKVSKNGQYEFNELEISETELKQLEAQGKLKNLRIESKNGEEIAKFQKNSIGNYSIKSSPAKVASSAPLSNDAMTIYYDFASSDLSVEAVNKIDNILLKYRAKSGSKLIVHTHTDSRGDAKYNEWLSQRRANQILQYLILEGVKYNEIEVKWHGESELANDCDDNTHCSEKKHSQNRRAVFELLQE